MTGPNRGGRNTADTQSDDPVPGRGHPPDQTLFTATTIGGVDLADRMAYQSRIFAEGGFALLITQGLYIDDQTGQGQLFQPGIASAAHAAV